MYSKFRPVVAGYNIDERSFFIESTTNTARHVNGKPFEPISSLSNILNCTANLRSLSAIIGYGKLVKSIFRISQK